MKTIQQVREALEQQSTELIPELIESLEADPRKGIQRLCKQYRRKHENFLKEATRVKLLRDFDQVFGSNGEYIIAGIDEVGRGPLAGPVVAAVVILPSDLVIEGVDDSKKLTQDQREALYDKIMDQAIDVGIGIVDANVIDEINILQATFKAMKKAVFSMRQCPDIILVDGNKTIPGINTDITQHAVVQGDAKSISIAAASIIAKVTRDRMMLDYNACYPQYNFHQNKGYGSSMHQQAIKLVGPSPIHRMSFLKNIIQE